jgi:hypothetical protein
VYGIAHIGVVDDPSAVEFQPRGLEFPPPGGPYDRLPGFGWIVVLPPASIARLGGIAAVKEGPFARVAVVSKSGLTSAVALTTSNPLATDRTERQQAIREYLRPVL